MRWLVRRVKHTIDDTRQLVREPRATLSSATLRIWRSRGGGFFGLGYLIAFGALEVRTFASELATTAGVSDFLMRHLIGFILRVTVESLVNVLQALLWPLLVLERFGAAGIVYLGIGYLVFERWLRAFIEHALPELRASSSSDGPVDPPR